MLLRRRSFFTSPQIRRKEVVSRRRSRRQASAFDENSSPESSSIKKVVVLGGGFGGLYCALKLDSLFATNTRGDDSGEKKKPTMIVTLIDTNEKFLFKPLMYELLNSDMEETDVAPLYEELLENTTV